MRISDWSSYVVSSDLSDHGGVSVTKVERSRLHHHHGASLSIAEDGRWRERKSLRDFRVSGRNRDPLQVWKGSNSWMIVAGSPSYSAVGMTPNSPLPAWKTTMQTIRVVARLQPRAWAFERDCRSEERRVGKEGVRTCGSGWSRYN